jgi:signal peptidase II
MNGIGGGRWLTYFGLAGGGFALDWWTKEKLFAELGPPGAFAAPDNVESIRWIWPGLFGLQTSLNEGALFGMGQGKVWIFATLSIAAAVAIFFWLFFRKAAQDRILLVALSGISGGIFGNLYDRLGLWWSPDLVGYPRHAVRDWILFRFQGWTWPNFNVADMLLVGGAGLLILHAWLTPTVEPAKSDAASPTNTAAS